MGYEVSRLSRNSADWQQVLQLCALFDTLIGDADGIYNPRDFNDKLLLGIKARSAKRSCTVCGCDWMLGGFRKPSVGN